MSYFEEIKWHLKEHINCLESILKINPSEIENNKIVNHLNETKLVNNMVVSDEPKDLKFFIEYLERESRKFGWSFPENKIEELFEKSFWELQEKIKKLIGGMSANERLYCFGFLEEFEKLPINHTSAREAILIKLFIY